MNEQSPILNFLPPGSIWRSRIVRTWRAIPLGIALLLMWIIMNEMFNWLVFFSGIVIAIVTIAATRAIIHRSYVDELWLGWRTAVLLFPFTMYQIALAAWAMAKTIVKGEPDYVCFSYQSILQDDLSVFLFCSMITLTPGSIVVNRKHNLLQIICIGKDSASARQDCETLEKQIVKILHSGGNLRARSRRVAASRRATKMRAETKAAKRDARRQEVS